jgi:hypothetical protein
MKNTLRITLLPLLLLAVSMVYGGVPAMNVTVSDAGGKPAFKGTTNGSGAFATSNLKPGNYVVQFNSKGAAVKGSHYAIVVSAGTKKVTAAAVPGEKFAGGGVAMKVDVGAGLNITGQVAAEKSGSISKNGKKMVWIPPQLGSNMQGHWAEEGSADAVAAKNAGNMSTQDFQRRQDQGVSPVSR